MKYAIISDIHGNMPALELVMEDARQNGAEAFLFTGDYCINAPWCNEVVSCIRSLPNARVVCGNEESYLHIPDRGDAQFHASRWTGRTTKPEHIAWLDALPERLDWEADGVAFHMTHDSRKLIDEAEWRDFSPVEIVKRYHADVSHEDFLADIRQNLAQNEDFQNLLKTLPSGVYLFGHSHIQWHAQFGDHWFINPGSCGLPLECGEGGAPYTLLTVEDGRCIVEERRIPYDVEAMIDRIRESELYAAASIWCEVLFREWRTRREHVIYFLRHVEQYANRIGDSRRPYMADTWEAGYQHWVAHGLNQTTKGKQAMKLVFLFGSGAVGKMTVGQELMKLTGLRLFHNHMTIEPVLEIFGMFNGAAVAGLRDVIFREFAKTDSYGMIFTYMWAFEAQSDWDYIEHVKEIFAPYGTEFYYVELVADQAVRLERNRTENRLKHKASKRDVELSDKRVINEDARHRLVSLPGEIPFENYLKIDNTHLSAEEAAKQIQTHFQL
ncbi:MAG: metallophosphoesterase family protein [Clostridia bacterium]|nr:metallophosphoesterase family protein [Clostridia bacterium]